VNRFSYDGEYFTGASDERVKNGVSFCLYEFPRHGWESEFFGAAVAPEEIEPKFAVSKARNEL
jgi:hypothetical protein